MAAETLQLDPDTYAERQRYMGRALIIALTAEGRAFDHDVREQSLSALGLSQDDYNIEVWKLVEDRRIEYTIKGPKPAAGTFPETRYEYHVRVGLVKPIAEKLDEVRFIKGAGRELQELALLDITTDLPSEVATPHLPASNEF